MSTEYQSLDPDEKFLVAILQQGLEDLQDPKYKASAWRYFISEDESNPTSFITICKMLCINPELILTKVKNHYLYGRPLTRNEKLRNPGDFSGVGLNLKCQTM